jgi:hypothetical protein
MCDKSCNGCPFAFTEESEIIQNYGCLPTPMEIVRMRVEFGKTWACHKEPTKPCSGSISYLKEKGHPYKMIDKELVTEQSDFLFGFGKLLRAEEKVKELEKSNERLLTDSRQWKKMFETAERLIRRIKRKEKQNVT